MPSAGSGGGDQSQAREIARLVSAGRGTGTGRPCGAHRTSSSGLWCGRAAPGESPSVGGLAVRDLPSHREPGEADLGTQLSQIQHSARSNTQPDPTLSQIQHSAGRCAASPMRFSTTSGGANTRPQSPHRRATPPASPPPPRGVQLPSPGAFPLAGEVLCCPAARACGQPPPASAPTAARWA